MRRRRCALFGVAALCLLATGAAARGGAEDMYAAVGDRVVQVQIIDASSGSRAGLGSGFLVGEEGVLATNYHVIAALVYRPGQYRAKYRTREGLGGSLELLAIDVVRDLALLRTDTLAAPPLELEPGEPARGERLFSFGNPLDLGLTVVEGTFNGYLEQSLLRKIHFTGSINPGMSGGPTVNQHGRVVGINVSTAGNQVSFLVPAVHLAALLEHDAPAAGDWLEVVGAQLLTRQQEFTDRLLGEPLATATLGPFRVMGKLGAYLNCWGDTADQNDEIYARVYQSCGSTDRVFLNDTHFTGQLQFRHEWLRADGVGALRFYSFLEDHFEKTHLTMRAGEQDVTGYACETGLVDENGFRAVTAFCARGYKRLPGLYDTVFTASSLVSPGQALHTSLALSGMSYTNAVAVSRAYLLALRWNPDEGKADP